MTTLDLSKAFDSVNHELLISKLAWYGVTDTTWFRSYLSGRSQIVRGGTLTLPVSCGVPQGSILGPILFILFTCDLPSHLTNGHLISFADDSHHIDSATPDDQGLTALKGRLELTMCELQAWFSANSLQMNEAKTNFMLAATKNHVKKTTGFTLDIDGSVVHASNKLKFLGVVIDAHLSWEAHISQVVKKCNYILVSFYRLRQYFTEEAMKLIMEAFVFPHLYYCLCAWGGATKIQLRKIKKLINFAARIVTRLKRPKIEHLVEERDLSKVFRLLTDPMTPTAIRDLLVPCADISSRTTRASQSGVLRLPRRRLTGSQRSFSFRAAAGWNALPQAAHTALLLDASKRATL